MLKAEFHAHTNHLQPKEGRMTPAELIDTVKLMGYDALTITEHYNKNSKQKIFHKDPLKTYDDFKDYAKEKKILLIPGAEVQLKEGEVLLVNFNGNAKDYTTLKDLDKLPRSTMTAAPHPFFMLKKQCIGPALEENIGKFDAIEHSHFYTRLLNLNKQAVALADKHNKPLIGTSDVHWRVQLNKTYTLVGSDKNTHSIIRAVRQNKIKLVTQPLSTLTFAGLIPIVIFDGINKQLRERLQ